MDGNGAECGLAVALRVLGGKWKPLILYQLGEGPRRFGELRRRVGGISEKVLIQQLRELEADRIVRRVDFKEVPPRVEYARTEFGHTLAAALMPLCAWGETHRRRIERIQASQGPPRGGEAPGLMGGEAS